MMINAISINVCGDGILMAAICLLTLQGLMSGIGQAAARQAAIEEGVDPEALEPIDTGKAAAPQVAAYGVPQLIFNEETNEVEQVIIEEPRVRVR